MKDKRGEGGDGARPDGDRSERQADLAHASTIAGLDETATSPPLTPPVAPSAPRPEVIGVPTRADDTRDERRAGRPLAAPSATGTARDLPFVDPSHYEIAGEQARGGLGRVLRARDRRLERTVALKELAHGPSARTAQRFVREALVTARLQHPSIVPVYEAGRWPSGDPFYAMKLVSGASLDEAIEKRPTLDARLALLPHVLAVAEAVAYAHSEGVIHRDLKPANVMLGAFGETQVVDWGLAKDRRLADADAQGAADDDSLYAQAHAEMTRVGSVVGTPAYMPPEQARGEEVDERADVYAIGAMLYHLLAAEPPFEGAPDTVVARVAKGPPPPLTLRAPEAPRDLVAIVDKAMARDASLRYPTAKELAQDLSRFLTGQLVGARAYGRMTLLARWLRRHRVPVAIAAVLLTLLAVTASVSAVRIVRERNVARARTAELVLTQARSLLERDPTATLAWLEQYPDDGADWAEVQRIAVDAQSRGVARHVLAGHPEHVSAMTLAPDGQRLATASGNLVQIWDTASGRRTARFEVPAVVDLAYSADGRWLALRGNDGAVELVPAATSDGKERRALGKHAGWLAALAFAPGGDWVASAGNDGAIELWNVATGAPRELRAHQGAVSWIQFVDGGRALLSAGADGQVLRWDVAAGTSRVLFGFELKVGVPFAASADGRLIAFAQGARVLAWRDGQPAPTELGAHAGLVTAIAVTRDGRVVTGSEDSTVAVWAKGPPGQRFTEHHRAITALAVSADGRAIASADAEGRIVLHDGAGARELDGHRSAVTRLAFAPGGDTLYSAGGDSQVRVWPVDATTRLVRAATQDVFRVAYVAHGARVATTSRDGVVRTIDTQTGAVQRVGSHPAAAFDLEELPRSGRLVTGSWDGELCVWSATEERACRSRPGAQLWAVAASPDERWLATAGSDGEVWLWPTSGGTGSMLHLHPGDAADVVFSPDGQLVASSGDDRVVRVRDLTTGRDRELRGAADVPQVLLFAHDGRTLYAAVLDGSVVAWDLGSGRMRTLGRHAAKARTLALSPDGTRLASGSADHTVRLWELRSGAVRVLAGHEGEVRHVAFSPDGRRLASAGWDGTVRLWDLGSGGARAFREQPGRVHRVAFAPDGAQLASGADDGTVALRRVDGLALVPAGRRALRAWLATTTDAQVEEK